MEKRRENLRAGELEKRGRVGRSNLKETSEGNHLKADCSFRNRHDDEKLTVMAESREKLSVKTP